MVHMSGVSRILGGRALRWGAVAVWMGVIFYLSAQPSLPNLAPGAPGLEEVAGHLFVYFVLALLMRWALAGEGVRYSGLSALAIVALYGISDEFHQGFVPNRTPSLSDWRNDLLGAGAALLLVWWLQRHWTARRS